MPIVQIRQSAHGQVSSCVDFDDVGSAAPPNAVLALHKAVQETFVSGKSLVLDRHIVGYWPIPEDGLS